MPAVSSKISSAAASPTTAGSSPSRPVGDSTTAKIDSRNPASAAPTEPLTKVEPQLESELDEEAIPILSSVPEEDRADETLRKSRSIVTHLRILTTLAILYTLYVAQAIFVPVFMSIVLYLLLRPAVRWMARKRIPEFVGAVGCLALLGVVLAAAVVPMIAPTRAWVADLPKNMERVGEKLKFLKTPLAQVKDLQARLSDFAAGDQAPKLFKIVVQQPELTSGTMVLSATGNMLGTGFVVLILTLFLLTTGDDLLNNVLSILPTFREKRKAVELIQEVQRGVSTYLVTITMINVALGIVVAIAMWLLGMPTPALWGLLVTVFNYIPFVGQGVAGLIVGSVALLSFDSIGYASLVVGVFYGIVAIEGHVITPALLGRHMSLNPVVVLLFLTLGGWMWGISGAALAVPVLAIIKIAFDRFECTRPVGTLLGGYRGAAAMVTPAVAA